MPIIQLRRGKEADLPGSPPLRFNEPVITSDTRRLFIGDGTDPTGGSAIVPRFSHPPSVNDSTDLPATTKFVQDVINAKLGTPPGNIALRDQDNTFTADNIFQNFPTVTQTPLPAATDNTNKVATMEWVQSAIDADLTDVAFKSQSNIFSGTNTYTATATIDASAAAVNVPTLGQTTIPGTSAASTKYVWDSLLNDTEQKKTLTPTISLQDVENLNKAGTPSTLIPSLDWIYQNVNSSSLLGRDNTWTGANTYNDPPTIVNSPAISDNSSKIPTTSWVRSAINTLMTGGGPVLRKSLVTGKRNTLEWTSGTVSLNGTNYTVAAGDYAYNTTHTAGTYYVVAKLSGGTVVLDADRTTPALGANEALLGSLTVTNVGGTPPMEISGVVNNPPDYARRDLDNIFNRKNVFKDEVRFDYGTGALSTIGSNGIEFNSTTIDLNGSVSLTPATGSTLPKGDYTIGINDENNKTLATTEWITSKLNTLPSSLFKLNNTTGDVELDPSVTGCLNLQGDCIILDPPSQDEHPATKKWVEDLIKGVSGIPIVRPGTGMTVEWTAGNIQLPAGLSCSNASTPNSCAVGVGIGGTDICRVAASTTPLSVSTTTTRVYVRYSDCAVLASDTQVDEATTGMNIAEVDATTTPVKISPIDPNKWAPIKDPIFIGTPTAPEPAKDACDNNPNQIATTGWVCDQVDALLHDSCGVSFPKVINEAPPSLLINVTAGQVPPDPSGTSTTPIQVAALGTAVAAVANSIEYAYIRYSDGKFVLSTVNPGSSGFLLATVTTNANSVTQIVRASNAVIKTKFSANYGVGYGGDLVYIGPATC